MITERFTRERKKKKKKRNKCRPVITNSSEPVCTWHEAGGICQVTKVSGFRKYKKARGERRSNGWDLAQQLQSSFATIGTYVSFSCYVKLYSTKQVYPIYDIFGENLPSSVGMCAQYLDCCKY